MYAEKEYKSLAKNKKLRTEFNGKNLNKVSSFPYTFKLIERIFIKNQRFSVSSQIGHFIEPANQAFLQGLPNHIGNFISLVSHYTKLYIIRPLNATCIKL